MFRAYITSRYRRVASTTTKGLLLFMLALGSFCQMETGLADNGDFTRLMLWFTSGPVGFVQSWPPDHSEEFHERFFHFTILYWKLDYPLRSRWVSSIILLWLPGIIFNILFYSHSVLYLPFLSLTSRVFSILFLFKLFRWIDKYYASSRCIMYCTFGVPYILIMVNTDYLAYFTSMYQEPASMVSLLCLLVLIVFYGKRELSIKELQSLGLLILLMNASKLSNIYWAALVFLYILPYRILLKSPKILFRYSMFLLVVPCAFSIIQANLVSTRQDNAYQSLFCGVLTFSDHPAKHLQDYNITDGVKSISVPAYIYPGLDMIAKYPSFMRHSNTLAIILKEPIIAWRMLRFASDSMQITHLQHLGHRTLNNNPFLQQGQRYDTLQSRYYDMFTLWSIIKQFVFPNGIRFLFTLILLIITFVYFLRKDSNRRSHLAYGGLLVSIACLVDIWIQMFGDGRQDLIKHLFLANILYDIAIIIVVNIMIITLISKVQTCSKI